MKIKAYRLYDQAVALQPAPPVRDWVKENARPPDPPEGGANLPRPDDSGYGWELLCPAAFEATWNGGPRPEDIDLRLAGTEAGQPAFVQSNLGEGSLTFYPGYQFKTDSEHLLWMRGPINAAKDGLAPLESMVDASLLPCTVASHWQFTRPQQTIRFEAGEPFATLLLYPKTGLENVRVEVMQHEDDAAAYEQAFQQMVDNPAVRDLFQRLSAAGDPQPTSKTETARPTDLPPVSCICPTYGRVELLEEAIYSFLQQDYPGQKELIVLNDYDRQTLSFDHPEVRVVNLPQRFHSVGEKYKAAVALASHELIFVWHDDDIYLPHRLSLAVARCDQKTAFFKAEQAWFWNDSKLSGPERNVFHGGSCWRRDLFNKVHGYPHLGNGYDLEFERLCQTEAPAAFQVEPIRPADIYYIYRWNGTGSYHLSGLGADGPEGQNVAAYVAQQAARGQIPQGEIRLKPGWKSDYPALVQGYLATLDTANGDAQATHSPPVSCFDTIDGPIDLQQFEPGFFVPERFFGRPGEAYLRYYGEVYRRQFYVIDALRLVYLSIPKTACSSIKVALAKANGIISNGVVFDPEQNIPYIHYHPQWHLEAGELTEAQNGYYRFSFVRNPFERLVSCYRQKILFTPTPTLRTPHFDPYFFSLPVHISFADFAQRVSKIPDALADPHFKSQYALLYRGDVLQVDYVGKLEQLDHDWQPIAEKYKLDPLLAHTNVSKNKPGCHSDYRLYYTEPLVQLVYERYRKDVHTFGYEAAYEQLLAFVRRHEQKAVPGVSEWERDREKETL